MAKADILLPNGTKIVVDGSVEDIKEIVTHSSQIATGGGWAKNKNRQHHIPVAKTAEGSGHDEKTPDIAAIVARIKDCDEAEQIESRVLNQKDRSEEHTSE